VLLAHTLDLLGLLHAVLAAQDIIRLRLPLPVLLVWRAHTRMWTKVTATVVLLERILRTAPRLVPIAWQELLLLTRLALVLHVLQALIRSVEIARAQIVRQAPSLAPAGSRHARHVLLVPMPPPRVCLFAPAVQPAKSVQVVV
jgi:hypothetical protein